MKRFTAFFTYAVGDGGACIQAIRLKAKSEDHAEEVFDDGWAAGDVQRTLWPDASCEFIEDIERLDELWIFTDEELLDVTELTSEDEPMTPEQIAKVCHEANRAYCQNIGDDSQPSWDDAPDWQKDSCIAGVEAHLATSLTPEQSHKLWLAVKEAEGWKYGPVKDVEKKEHPCCVPYAELPAEQQRKDALFKAVVEALK